MMAGGEIQSLPEPVIQRVQYFLTRKEAARTSVLSKSWGSAWLTRPNLDFDLADFGKDNFISSCDPLLEFADKTLKRYEDSNLKIDSLCLRIKNGYDCDHTLITNMTLRALKLGATRLAFYTQCTDFVLPNEVFASENLIELTLDRCEIDLGPNRDVIRCSRLQSLSLECVEGRGYREVNINDTLSRIISSCPLIEKLSLSHIYNLRGGGVIVDGGDLIVLPRLRSLVLAKVGPATLFLFTRGLSYKFPSLKDLTLEMYTWHEEDQDINVEMLISSTSLERLHLKTERKESWRFKLDVPSIRKFTYEGDSIPPLTFGTTPKGGWESHVLITRGKCLTASWFRRLSKLFKKLRRSRIHLCLKVYSRRSYDYRFGDLQGLPTRVIENLTIKFHYAPSLNCFALLDGLFLTCRPKLITPKDNIDFVGQTLLRGLDVKPSNPNQSMYGLKDLEEAKAQLFDADVWRDVPLDAFQDKSITLPAHDNRVVRFQLKWQS